MSTNVYEGMFLLDSNRYARDPNGVSSEIDQIVEKCGGQILVSRLWSEQRLAYPIEGHRKGTYWLAYFKLDSLQQPALNRACQLNDNILRNLILKVDHRLVDALVSHAGRPATATPAATAATATAATAATGETRASRGVESSGDATDDDADE